MEKLVGDILTQGLTTALMFSMVKLIVIFFIVVAIRNFITNLVNRRLAYRRLKLNKYLKAGAWVEWPTTTGSVTTQVDRITKNKVVLRTKDKSAWIHVPIMQFADSALCLPDTVPGTADNEDWEE